MNILKNFLISQSELKLFDAKIRKAIFFENIQTRNANNMVPIILKAVP